MQYKPKIKAPNPELIKNIQNILNNNALTTVCEAVVCPNRAECYARNSATFMILGDVCTRACSFCNVKTGHGKKIDTQEPQHLAQAIKEEAYTMGFSAVASGILVRSSYFAEELGEKDT